LETPFAYKLIEKPGGRLILSKGSDSAQAAVGKNSIAVHAASAHVLSLAMEPPNFASEFK